MSEPFNYRSISFNFVGSVVEAERLAGDFLAERLPVRWKHVQGVAALASELAERLDLPDQDKALLVVSAWYHDIGYALQDGLRWHPVDGGLLLRGWELDLPANLVAWHTTAEEEAVVLGHEEALAAFGKPSGLVSDALTYADMSTGPDGSRLTFEERFEEIKGRHGVGSFAVVAMEIAWPRLEAVRAHVESALS